MTTQFCFMDWETQSDIDLTEVGALRYALDLSTRPLLFSWATDDVRDIDDEDAPEVPESSVKLWARDLSDVLHPEVWAYALGRLWCYGEGTPKKRVSAPYKGMPQDVVDVAANPEGYFVAWNMGFDRAIWQQVATPDFGFPEITIEKTLDAMAQAQASNLPGALNWAGRALNIGEKTAGGKTLMKLFATTDDMLPGNIKTIAQEKKPDDAIKRAIDMWATYLDYSVQDTELMRKVWHVTRQLDATEWQEYWVSERINDRGMLADLDVCKGATAYREEEAVHVAEECVRLTDGAIARPTLTQAINKWLYAQLPHDLGEHMVKERDEEGNVIRLTGAKTVITRLLDEIKSGDAYLPDNVLDFIELMEFGRSSSAIKFEKILNQAVDGRLCGSYVYNGAGQSGRYSSRGVQVHNLPRAAVNKKDNGINELDALDMVAAQVPIEQIRKIGPVSSILSKLIRPTFIAPEGKKFIWGDWAAIEGRVNPWLANSRDAEQSVLTPYRNGQDLYVLNAATIFNVDAQWLQDEVNNGSPEAKAMRQAGKVAVLALGFLGGVGALKSMARGYGLRLTEEEATQIVQGWRERNRWARRFGDKCERAAFSAIETPMKIFAAGRLQYQYVPELMGGTLVCFLPDKRPIVYPRAKIEKQEKFGRMADVITYLSGMARRSLWNGLQIENGTQGLAASILRGTLTRLEAEENHAIIVGHTHDEIIEEVDNDEAPAAAKRLHETMVRGFDWSEGLPLEAEVEMSWYYTKDGKATTKIH